MEATRCQHGRLIHSVWGKNVLYKLELTSGVTIMGIFFSFVCFVGSFGREMEL